MLIIAFGVMFAVIGLIGVAYYIDQGVLPERVNQIMSFTTDSKCNVAGDCVDFFIPKIPENHDTVPVDYDIETVTEATFYENGTEKTPSESYITGNINDVSYTKFGTKESKYSAVGDIMQVQIGNIATIQGQIKMIDPTSGEIIEPRTAKYTLIISCSELTEFCNLTPVTKRSTTSTTGTFIEKWTTDSSLTEGLYDVEIFAISETKNQFGIPYDVTNTLHLELFK